MLLYNLGVYLYTCFIHIAANFDPKAKLWVNGRRDWRTKLSAAIKKTGNQDLIWVHCASLGEFEQGRPVIEKIKQQSPDSKILLSFFSPSGYEIRKNYELADVICYLPHDSKKNAIDFINICKPKTVIFVKYEFWLNYLFQLKAKNIPTYLISAVIKQHQPFFKWYGGQFIKGLNTYKTIFVQDEESLKLLKSLGTNSGVICGDTRVDRVLEVKESVVENKIVKEFSASGPTIIAGSTWPKDNVILIESFLQLKKKYPELKLIIAPHEVDEKSIKELSSLLDAHSVNYSLYKANITQPNCDILVVNTIGVLAAIYQYAKLAYIGGGFNNGIHNILEPAVFGLPVLFGPNRKKFNEAAALIANGAAFEIHSSQEVSRQIDQLLSNSKEFMISSQAAINYINQSKGASMKIIEHVFNRLN